MFRRRWTSMEAERIYHELQQQLSRTDDAEAARLLRARCDWLVAEFTATLAAQAA